MNIGRRFPLLSTRKAEKKNEFTPALASGVWEIESYMEKYDLSYRRENFKQLNLKTVWRTGIEPLLLIYLVK